MSESLEIWAEQSKILVHCMVGAGTLEEALDLNIRFATLFWGKYIETELRHEGDHTAVIFREPLEQGRDGLIRAMWPLIATLSQLEFLAGGPLKGVSGRVPTPACVPRSTVALLFRGLLAYNADEAALVIPKHLLQRPVVARARDIPAFFEKFMLITVTGVQAPIKMRPMIEALLRSGKISNPDASADLPSLATRLHQSVATIRRRLRSEGTTFRSIKDDVFDDIAKAWLRETDYTIEAIATMLGYSDTYGFRRAFHRRNAIPPLSYRHKAGLRKGADLHNNSHPKQTVGPEQV
ncbi:AraC family transcriptional regulator [Acidocella aquatica]|uniref:AraC family transcriptional regulator n=2 Tax=Acidocella aquatica TaxID=1922313 RepID=A0ABQ6A981_9PROT|nr:AraC family transcriptional regulator [Acidocella aquatica]